MPHQMKRMDFIKKLDDCDGKCRVHNIMKRTKDEKQTLLSPSH